MKGIGGQIWAVPNKVMHPTKYYLITAGTRFTAIYRAWDEEKKNPSGNTQVAATLAGQTPPVLLFAPRTPRYVLEWLRDTGDRWDTSDRLS